MKYSQIEDLRNQIIAEFKNYILHKIPRDFLNKEFDTLGECDKIQTCKITEMVDKDHLKMIFGDDKPSTFLMRSFNSFYIGDFDSFVETFVNDDNNLVKNIKKWRNSIQMFFTEQPTRVIEKPYLLRNGYDAIPVLYITSVGIIDNSGLLCVWDDLDCYQLEQLLNYYMYDYYAMKE